MADTTLTLNSGSGGEDLAGDDDVTNGFHQYVKLKFGASGTQTTVTSSVGLPVNIVQDSLAGLTVNLSATDNDVLDQIDSNTDLLANLHSEDYDTGAGTDTTSAIGLAIPSNSGAVAVDSTNPLPIDVQFGSSQAATNTGNSNANTQRVVLATDQPSVTIDNGGTFVVQEDGAALTALQLIDDAIYTDDAAITLGTSKGIGIMAFAGTQSVNANDAGFLAMETDGSLHIHDGGNSITVDSSDLSTIAGAVSGTEMQVDIVAALPAGSNSIGTLGANSGVDIGDVDVTSVVPGTGATALGKAEDAVHSSGDTGVMSLAVRNDDLAALAGTDGDYSPFQVDEFGAQYVTDRADNMYRNIDANAEAAIKASAGTLNWVHAINLTAAIAYLHLYNDTTGNVTPGMTTPDFTFPIPTQGDTNGAGFNIKLNQYFDTAITLVCTTTTDGSAGDPGTNGVMINAGYT